MRRAWTWPGSGEPSLHHYTRYPLTRVFIYRCWESPHSADAYLWRRTKQRVTVLRQLKPAESDFEIYEVAFQDGILAHVFADELA